MNSKVKWGKIIWNMTRFMLKLTLTTISALIEIGFESKQKNPHPFGIFEARYREEKGLISPLEISKIMHDEG